PRFYLAGFTPDGSRDGKVYVLDAHSRRQWRASIKDAACERDFYRIDLESGFSNKLEELCQLVEEGGAEAIRFITEKRRIPDGDLYGDLMAFLALSSARVPGSIRALTEPFEKVSKDALMMMTASKERWDAQVAQMKADGHDVGAASWEEMRDFVRSDQCQI